ncbi:MAG: methyltransferase domain-containing protein [Chloroflexi bacterium]|nr:methyltransferase domain-containing protein [Chloroflexota bacterium]
METPPTLFHFAAQVGLTKHMGGVEATEALVQQCHIGADSCVLDVGCGVGASACFLARRYGCRVVGVDILPEMAARSQERAKRERLADRVTFRVADAQALPFADGVFDTVLSESATSFPDDKARAVDEYARVTKAGGYVGLSESVWLKAPPPPAVAAWVAQDVGATVQPLTTEEWVRLLEAANLTVIGAQTFTVNTKDEAKGLVQRYGLGGTLRAVWGMLQLYARSAEYRRFVQGVRRGGVLPPNLEEFFGYGLFVGRK